MSPSTLINAAACAVLFWIAGSFLLAHPRAAGFKQLALQLALLLMMVGSAVSAIASVRAPAETLPWWTLTLRAGGALGAVCLYDLTFGIAEQTIATVRHVLGTPARIRAWWARSLAQAHARNASTTRR